MEGHAPYSIIRDPGLGGKPYPSYAIRADSPSCWCRWRRERILECPLQRPHSALRLSAQQGANWSCRSGHLDLLARSTNQVHDSLMKAQESDTSNHFRIFYAAMRSCRAPGLAM